MATGEVLEHKHASQWADKGTYIEPAAEKDVSLTGHKLLEAVNVIISDPPSGKYRVINLYVDPDTGKLTVKYDDTPV